MQTNEKLEAIEDWLITLALGSPTMSSMFDGLFQRFTDLMRARKAAH